MASVASVKQLRSNSNGSASEEASEHCIRTRASVLARITIKQIEFLRLIADPRELTYAQIADILGVHRRTVDSYFQGLREEFGIRSKTGMLLFAVKWGIVEIKDDVGGSIAPTSRIP